MIDLFLWWMIISLISVFGIAGLILFFQSPIPKKCPFGTIVLSIIILLCILLFGIHIQIPNQNYCDDIKENNYGMGSVYYQESLTRYDFSLNESKCIYSDDGKFIVNSKYSIWGLRI